MIKILHTGDIHLDSPFTSVSGEVAARRRNEVKQTFQRMFDYAEKEKIDMILICGDLFDAEFITRETVNFVSSVIGRVSCPVVITPGNHDCYADLNIWRKGVFPENAYIFDSENLSSFVFDEIGVRVYGYAFKEKYLLSSPIEGKKASEDGYISILCAHGDTESAESKYCPLKIRDIEAFGADYTALGHIHNPKEISDRIAYCGCPEGRAFDECGEKGAVIVSIEEGLTSGRKVSYERVRFSSKRYEMTEVYLTPEDSNITLSDKIIGTVRDGMYGEDTLLRVNVKGRSREDFSLDLQYVRERVLSLVPLSELQLTDASASEIDIDALEKDPTVKGEFYRCLKDRLMSEDEAERRKARKAFRLGIAALTGEDFHF